MPHRNRSRSRTLCHAHKRRKRDRQSAQHNRPHRPSMGGTRKMGGGPADLNYEGKTKLTENQKINGSAVFFNFDKLLDLC